MPTCQPYYQSITCRCAASGPRFRTYQCHILVLPRPLSGHWGLHITQSGKIATSFDIGPFSELLSFSDSDKKGWSGPSGILRIWEPFLLRSTN